MSVENDEVLRQIQRLQAVKIDRSWRAWANHVENLISDGDITLGEISHSLAVLSMWNAS